MSHIAERIRRRQGLSWLWLPGWLVDPRGRCPHERQRGIYGDEINASGGKRARCLDCGRLLDELPPPSREVPYRRLWDEGP